MKKISILFFLLLTIHRIVNSNEIVNLICITDTIQKKFSFFYIPKRNVVIWLQKAREVPIKKTKKQTIYFDFHGDFGGGVDTVSSKLFFVLNIESGKFLLRKDDENNMEREQRGKCKKIN